MARTMEGIEGAITFGDVSDCLHITREPVTLGGWEGALDHGGTGRIQVFSYVLDVTGFLILLRLRSIKQISKVRITWPSLGAMKRERNSRQVQGVVRRYPVKCSKRHAPAPAFCFLLKGVNVCEFEESVWTFHG